MLKEIIKSKGLKQSYVAKRIGVSVVTMSNWVKNKSTPSKKNLEKLKQFGFVVMVQFLLKKKPKIVIANNYFIN